MTLSAADLHVVTAIFNPQRWKTRIAHYKKFAEHMVASGVKLTVVECALGRRDHELADYCPVISPQVEHIPVRCETLTWSKEALLNIGIQRSRFQTPFIGWIDADVEFSNKNWALDTVHALQQFAVVQPWSTALDLGPDGEPMLVKGFHLQTAFAKVWHETMDIQGVAAGTGPYAAGWKYPHPGYGAVWRRDVLKNVGGLLDVSGLGAADHQMCMALIGRIDKAIHGQTTPSYQAAVKSWAERAYKYVQGNFASVPGTLSHSFHGQKEGKHGRRYQERWDILVRHKFDPVTDLKRNLDGVIELAGNKPAMRHEFDLYFSNRREDANILIDD